MIIMKIEISVFDEEEEYYDHHGYYNSIAEAIRELYDLFFREIEKEEEEVNE